MHKVHKLNTWRIIKNSSYGSLMHQLFLCTFCSHKIQHYFVRKIKTTATKKEMRWKLIFNYLWSKVDVQQQLLANTFMRVHFTVIILSIKKSWEMRIIQFMIFCTRWWRKRKIWNFINRTWYAFWMGASTIILFSDSSNKNSFNI